MSFKYKRLDKNDAAVLLIDHQTGLFNLVRDFEPIQFKNNVLALADSANSLIFLLFSLLVLIMAIMVHYFLKL